MGPGRGDEHAGLQHVSHKPGAERGAQSGDRLPCVCVVTANLRHFPVETLSGYEIEAYPLARPLRTDRIAHSFEPAVRGCRCSELTNAFQFRALVLIDCPELTKAFPRDRSVVRFRLLVGASFRDERGAEKDHG